MAFMSIHHTYFTFKLGACIHAESSMAYYFFAFINERLHIRMDDESLLSDNCSILSSVSGLPKDSIEKLTKKLLSIHLHNEEVNEQDMTLCIDQMNAILKKLM